MDKFLNVNEVAEMLNCAKSTIHRYITYEDLPVLKVGKKHKLLFDKDQIEYWLRKKTREAKKLELNSKIQSE